MSFKSAIAVLSAASLLSAQALAATAPARIAEVQGDVSILSGKSVVAAHTGASVQAGDRILVRQGQASLRFSDGCAVKLPQGSLATVAAKSPCAGGKSSVAAQTADAAQWYKLQGPWDTGAIFAVAGSALLVGAFIYGLTDPTKCDGVVENDGSCTPSP